MGAGSPKLDGRLALASGRRGDHGEPREAQAPVDRGVGRVVLVEDAFAAYVFGAKIFTGANLCVRAPPYSVKASKTS
jgi:hypothetical protein